MTSLAMPKEIIPNAFVRLGACKTSLALAKKQWPKVNQYFQESLSSLESGVNPSAELMLRNSYADALEKQGQLNEAAVQRNQAQGLLRRISRAFKHSNLYAFFLTPRQIEFGKDFQVRFDIVNISVEPTEIIAIEGLTPRGLKVQRISDCCSVDGDCIMVHPKTIGPFQTSSLKIDLQAERTGFFTFTPQLRYMGDDKKVMKYELSPVIVGLSAPLVDHSEELTIDASADLNIEFHNELSRSAFQYLLHCFVQDFARQKMPLDVAGWRTLMDIAKNTKITKHSLYEFSRSKGKPISELERIGLVESKYFLGQRGRGGRVLKVRAFYDNQAVRAQIKRLTTK
jgi:hypothetical protein